MEPLAPYRITLHLNSGQSISTLVNDVDQDVEDMADELRTALSSDRPRWLSFGNIVAFSGAVSGIEIEAL